MSVRTLMAINALIIANGEEVYEAKTKSTKDGILRVHYPLPEWCIRDDNGYLDYSENYLQFVNDSEEPGYDKVLLAEINDRLKNANSDVVPNLVEIY